MRCSTATSSAPPPACARKRRCPSSPSANALIVPGGAANTAVNLAALGCQVELMSVVGADPGRRPAPCPAPTTRRRYPACSPSRMLVGRSRSSGSSTATACSRGSIKGTPIRSLGTSSVDSWRSLIEAFVRADAVVISDYAYGVLTAGLIGDCCALQQRFERLIAVDARDLTRYRTVGVTVVKPNFGEALRLVGHRSETVHGDARRAGADARRSHP